MARTKPRKLTTSRVIVIILLLGGAWLYQQWRGPKSAPTPSAPLPELKNESFESLQNAELIFSEGNDGDSFKVELKDGRVETFRLYFVDTPETSARYPDRIRYQSEYFGDLEPEQTMEIGREAKAFTLDLLKKHPFVILTRWEKVMKSYRYHAFALVETEPGKFEYLSEILIRKGLARIYTMPADTPDGQSKTEFKNHLKSLEAQAKKTNTGAWQF